MSCFEKTVTEVKPGCLLSWYANQELAERNKQRKFGRKMLWLVRGGIGVCTGGSGGGGGGVNGDRNGGTLKSLVPCWSGLFFGLVSYYLRYLTY